MELSGSEILCKEISDEESFIKKLKLSCFTAAILCLKSK